MKEFFNLLVIILSFAISGCIILYNIVKRNMSCCNAIISTIVDDDDASYDLPITMRTEPKGRDGIDHVVVNVLSGPKSTSHMDMASSILSNTGPKRKIIQNSQSSIYHQPVCNPNLIHEPVIPVVVLDDDYVDTSPTVNTNTSQSAKTNTSPTPTPTVNTNTSPSANTNTNPTAKTNTSPSADTIQCISPISSIDPNLSRKQDALSYLKSNMGVEKYYMSGKSYYM